jgi:DNA-binding response OmpR family regulator
MLHSNNILIAEDNGDYAMLLQLALEKAGIQDQADVVSDREQLIEHLTSGAEGALPLPRLIIIALRLPMFYDFQALRWIRAQRRFDQIPVAVLSGIEYPGEGRRALELGAEFYAVKPSGLSELVRLLAGFHREALQRSQCQSAA